MGQSVSLSWAGVHSKCGGATIKNAKCCLTKERARGTRCFLILTVMALVYEQLLICYVDTVFYITIDCSQLLCFYMQLLICYIDIVFYTSIDCLDCSSSPYQTPTFISRSALFHWCPSVSMSVCSVKAHCTAVKVQHSLTTSCVGFLLILVYAVHAM